MVSHWIDHFSGNQQRIIEMKKTAILVFLVIALFGCGKEQPVSRFHHFPNGVWERFQFVKFDFAIEDINKDWNIYLVVRYDDSFVGQTLPVNLVMNTPSGGERIRDLNLYLRNSAGENTGESREGIYELVTLTHPGIFFSETGVCRFELENFSPRYFTQGILEIGLVLEPIPRQR
jgi:gliding motility-associated lipoprotein GldH